jgi:PTH1 family peptidyl-tRNA hydrolase
MIRLIVFLGNKGPRYTLTRHNAGFLFLDAFRELSLQTPWQEKFHGQWTKGRYTSQDLYLLKPMTFMNASGKSVGAFLRYFSLDPQELLIVHDDIELPFRTVRLQQGGSPAGHNGLRSIAQELKSTDWYRMRIGIGRPNRQDVASYVLSRFSVMEEAELPLVFSCAASLLQMWFDQNCQTSALPITRTVGSLDSC